MIIDLEQTLNSINKNNTFATRIGNIIIYYQGTKEDTAKGKREVYILERYLDE